LLTVSFRELEAGLPASRLTTPEQLYGHFAPLRV